MYRDCYKSGIKSSGLVSAGSLTRSERHKSSQTFVLQRFEAS